MKVDLSTLPFSRRGSCLVISELNENWNGSGNEAGLFLRTVHGSALTPFVARIYPAQNGKPMEYTAEISEAALLLTEGSGRIECCFDDPDTLLIRGNAGTELTLDFLSGSGPYDYIYSFTWTASAFLVMCHEFL